jgi:hypothetical protein
MNAFCPQISANGPKETLALLITTTGSSVAHDISNLGPDLKISARSNALYFRFGNASTTVTASTAATQGDWLPSGAIIRIKKPVGASHIIVLQDTGAAQVFIQGGDGI